LQRCFVFVANEFFPRWTPAGKHLTIPGVKTRTFGQTNLAVSEIGLGCWQLGGADWGNLDERRALAILNTAADAGITVLDTADVYGMGRSETLIGKFRKQRPGKYFIATKLGRMPDLYPDQYTEAGVRAATEASLRRLGVDELDLTQLHCVPPPVLQGGEIFDWLRRLQREGKVNYFGASVESMDEANICLAQEGLCSLQIIFNLFRHKPRHTIFAEARKKRVGLIVRLPLASGLLGGNMTKHQKFARTDHRNYNRDGQCFNVGETFAGLPFEKGVELAEALKRFVPAGMTLAELAQRWILDHDAVSTVITGASQPEQAAANARVSSLPPLSPELHEKLAEFYENLVAHHVRGPY
jgi:aryl-alcohol dehydrogenase-like predicted oxidoreductase